MFNDVIDWAADIVQTMTGEKERRSLVEEFKNKYEEFKRNLEQRIGMINAKIAEFNMVIRKINTYRKHMIGSNISVLGEFLGKFGNVKAIGEYANENESNILTIPERQLECKENYISEIDWSRGEVFCNTFILGPIGMKMKTHKQNLSMKERLGLFQIEIDGTLNQLQLKETSVVQDREIADLYLFCINTISTYIKNVVIPELEVIETFFQVLKLKNEIIAGHKLENICFSNNILVLKDTQYERHFLFVRNTFLFYIISVKIYNTPVLTKLISGNISNGDIETLKEKKELLLEQKSLVNQYLLFDRGC